ncbi:MAG: zf-HC2 domain-containing protein [Nitrospirae bacterium]|nr:zf-HC2 domain-containing protein [Nitrospirota bacterium]
MDSREDEGLDSIIAGLLNRHDMDASGVQDACPDPLELARFLGRALGDAGARAVREHIAGCPDCLNSVIVACELMDVPAGPAQTSVLQAGLGALHNGACRTLEIAVGFVRDSIELISTTGRAVYLPEPLAARSGMVKPRTLLKTTEQFTGFMVDVEVEKTGCRRVDLIIGTRLSGDGGPCLGLRASLFQDGRELSSIYMEDGRSTFEQLPPGNYTVILSESGKQTGDIHLNITG